MNDQQLIEQAYDSSDAISEQVKTAVTTTLAGLDSGELRVAEKVGDTWQVNQWIKKAILLSFRINPNKMVDGDWIKFYDKVENKFAKHSEEDFLQQQVRAVPGAIVRAGAYIAKNVVLMPSFVNLGAYVGEGTLVDTWATVGSCAQIGKNVHLSGGVGIGGVLEPLQAAPTIIEDDFMTYTSLNKKGSIVKATVVEVTPKGAVVTLAEDISGYLKAGEIAEEKAAMEDYNKQSSNEVEGATLGDLLKQAKK